MNAHTREDLKIMRKLPLEIKIRMTERRIKDWINEFGEEGVYIAFSGGKDSTVLVDIIHNRLGYNEIPLVYSDTGLEYPEIRTFVRTFDNVVILRPKENFKTILNKWGYPFFSKEVSEKVYYARKYIETGKTGIWAYQDLMGINRRERGQYSIKRYSFMKEAPFKISNRCCYISKKEPFHRYYKETGRKPITAQTTEESKLRESQWIRYGCNGFGMKYPISNPMSFWTEQDVLKYIVDNDIKICSVYGDIIEENGILRTTKCTRTGCMFCGYGCHLEKGKGRFERLKETHPKVYDYIMKPSEEGGLNYKNIIDWINENGKFNIKY